MGPVAGYPLGAQAGKIFLIPPTGGNPKQIDPPGILEAGCPIWSPDGTHLLFYGSDSSNLAVWFPTSDWWVWPLAGGNAVKTGAFEVFAAQDVNLTVPSLVPAPSEWMDDQVFFSAKAGDSVSLWQVSISLKNWRITGPAHRLTTGSGLDIRPSFAKTGLLVFSSLIENADIWSLPIDASQGRVKDPPEQLTHDLALDYLPSMSADGKKLAFVSERSGNPDIWMKDLENGKEKPLTASPAKEISSEDISGRKSSELCDPHAGPASELKPFMSSRQKEGCSRSSATDAASPGVGPQTIRFSFTHRLEEPSAP